MCDFKQIRTWHFSLSGAADIFVTYKPIARRGWNSEEVGKEANVLCVSSKKKKVLGKYLDHDDRDSTTRDFFALQTREPKHITRDYYDNIY